MSFSLSNIFRPQTTTTASPMVAPGAPAPAGSPAYRMDALVTSFGTAGAAPTVKQPIESLIDDPGAASRFRFLFVKSSEGLLRVGGDGGAFGRFFLNLMAGSVPFITPAARRQEIAANVMTWVGRADLVRTGCSPTDARLLQAAGISNVTDLARMANPLDQATLLSRMAISAMTWNLMPPSPQQISAWVSTAMSLQPRIR